MTPMLTGKMAHWAGIAGLLVRYASLSPCKCYRRARLPIAAGVSVDEKGIADALRRRTRSSLMLFVVKSP